MASIKQSVRAYESWMRKELGREMVEKDLTRKHEKMAESPFVFLRGTFWRWAETILEVCPDLAQAPTTLAVGDIHLENFGTWRDEDGRLVWGVNDFDEAAEMPFAIDLVRLATSALLAKPDREMPTREICGAILAGYRQGLEAPQAIVLDRDWAWLRQLVVVSDKARARFWGKIEQAAYKPAPRRYIEALVSAMPVANLQIRTAPRTAGTGSLGRPRWIGVTDWHGTPVVREVKVILASAWPPGVRCTGAEQAMRNDAAARGKFRANDPWYRLKGNLLVRRLSPNNRKLEAEGGSIDLLTPDMLRTMGLELANVHLGNGNRRGAILRDLARREDDWLRANTKRAAAAVTRDYEEWKATA
jgi:Ser/Thr protein kinase RdoA (MazF antagonist)